MLLTVLQILYFLIAVGLAIVGFNTLVLSLLYLRHSSSTPLTPDSPSDEQFPHVLIQLPIYNELHVTKRLIKAVAAFDYPADKLEIQVLDDSTDQTVSIASAAVRHARQSGINIHHVQREDRTGYKAGALNYGLTKSTADFVAVFDADFTPKPDFLQRVMPYFIEDDSLGMVQTRWSHLNAETSLLTRAQALALDAHFVVEQTARHRSGLLMNFSGTAGVWRTDCIHDSGGWQHDTLSEDIDLSYRAQLRGWRFLYLPEIDAPAEVPPLMMGFKRQQSRWATGTVQCLRKQGRTLLSSHLNIWQKVQGIVHLGGYFLHPLMLLLMLITLPLLLTDSLSSIPLAGLGLAMLGSPLQAIISQRYIHKKNWLQKLTYFPVFMVMGIGIAVSNSFAVWRGLTGQTVAFRRTPKFELQGQNTSWLSSAYTLPIDPTTWFEIAFALYAALLAVLSIAKASPLAPFMLLYAVGFAYVAALSLWQTRTARRLQSKQHHSHRTFSASK